MEASALSTAAQKGLLARKSPLLKMKGDEQLVALVRAGNPGAFDVIVDRYQSRLLGFCRQMLGSTEDAEDVLQEVFVNAYRAMLADNRAINLKPWLYRIARNRSLNHLRRPKAEAQESMDMVPMVEAASTAEKVHNREEFRQLLNDVTKLPETQRAALLLREIDAMSYEEIAEAMETTVPAVKSLLVRARISLAEASQARMLTCGEVKVELAEAAEGLTKASGPVRRHVKDCESCAAFRKQLKSDSKVLAMIMPIGPIVALKAAFLAKLGIGGAGSAGTAAGGAGSIAAGSAVGATAAGSAAGAASGIGAIGGAVGMKAVAGLATAAVITAGAVEVRNVVVESDPVEPASKLMTTKKEPAAPQPVTITAPEAVVTEEVLVAVEPVAEIPVVEAPAEPVPVAGTEPESGAVEASELAAPAGGGQVEAEAIIVPTPPATETTTTTSPPVTTPPSPAPLPTPTPLPTPQSSMSGWVPTG
ncbi:MAG: sigma-70 family RNA polymerase sigma factor [Solirubrobacterales bacterium]